MNVARSEAQGRNARSRWRRTFQVADYAFEIEGDDPQLEALAGSLYRAAQKVVDDPRERFQLICSGGQFQLLRDGTQVCAAAQLSTLFQEVEWALTETIMQRLEDFFQFHAAVAVFAGRATLVVGPPDAGKTSLVLGLASIGGMVFTDEVALIDASGLCVTPFPRDLIVHGGTQRLFSELVEKAVSPPWKVFAGYRHLSMCDLGLPAPVGTAVVDRLLFPALQPGTEPVCRSLGQAEAARRLLEQAFNLSGRGGLGIELVGRLVEACPAVQLSFGDARRAAAWFAGRC